MQVGLAVKKVKRAALFVMTIVEKRETEGGVVRRTDSSVITFELQI
jgi:hypothetical protein